MITGMFSRKMELIEKDWLVTREKLFMNLG
jgi:hypothetical protein